MLGGRCVSPTPPPRARAGRDTANEVTSAGVRLVDDRNASPTSRLDCANRASALAGGSLAGPIGAFLALRTAALITSFISNYPTTDDVVYESPSTTDVARWRTLSRALPAQHPAVDLSGVRRPRSRANATGQQGPILCDLCLFSWCGRPGMIRGWVCEPQVGASGEYLREGMSRREEGTDALRGCEKEGTDMR
jgi:hypothetical protein